MLLDCDKEGRELTKAYRELLGCGRLYETLWLWEHNLISPLDAAALLGRPFDESSAEEAVQEANNLLCSIRDMHIERRSKSRG